MSNKVSFQWVRLDLNWCLFLYFLACVIVVTLSYVIILYKYVLVLDRKREFENWMYCYIVKFCFYSFHWFIRFWEWNFYDYRINDQRFIKWINKFDNHVMMKKTFQLLVCARLHYRPSMSLEIVPSLSETSFHWGGNLIIVLFSFLFFFFFFCWVGDFVWDRLKISIPTFEMVPSLYLATLVLFIEVGCIILWHWIDYLWYTMMKRNGNWHCTIKFAFYVFWISLGKICVWHNINTKNDVSCNLHFKKI